MKLQVWRRSWQGRGRSRHSRPRSLRVVPASQHGSFAVGHAEQLGGATTFTFPEPGFALQVPGQVPARHGETIALDLPLEHVYVFDAEQKALPRRQPRPAPAIVTGTAP
jgi:hypothetical protein